ncbi:pentapeptide repeat-containing protein [Streptomyces sp. NPDC093544]|uniref:pentapeptide repeat-containing protein n=1 Tax=Streptomyces sp. NPDC093544 TaxID=3155200 RepID=UPI00342AAC39
MSPRLPRRQTERRGLRLWPVGTVLTLAFITAMTVASAAFYAGWHFLGAQEMKTQAKIDSKTLFNLVKLSFGVVAGAGALVALVVAYRRQRVNEDGALRDATRLHTERFTTAVSQLGDSSPAVRLGGVHALAGLADDAPTRDLRQTCIDVLCAYLRLPYTAETDLPTGDTDAQHNYLALREVRHTIIRLIRDHLRRPADNPHSWQGHDLDFTCAVFDGGDLSGATFSSGTVNFSDATFASGTVRFLDVTFSGGTVNFTGATFTGGTVGFNTATFSGSTVNFVRTTFNGTTLNFTGATFTGGTVDFNTATLNGIAINFVRATLNGGTVNFKGATFNGIAINFTDATFNSSTVHFARTTLNSGAIRFKSAKFNGGTLTFKGTTFNGGTLTFGHARFMGSTIIFNSTTFDGGTVSFEHVTGNAPTGLPGLAGSPIPTGLTLATGW